VSLASGRTIGNISRHLLVTYDVSLSNGDLITAPARFVGGEYVVTVRGGTDMIVNSGAPLHDDEAGNSCWLITSCASHRRNRSKSP
jgi:hypothetical protein